MIYQRTVRAVLFFVRSRQKNTRREEYLTGVCILKGSKREERLWILYRCGIPHINRG